VELSSRHIVALGAPLIVTYLTWSAVSGGATKLAEIAKNAPISTTAASKRPRIDALSRNPFAPADAADDPLAALATSPDGKDSEQGNVLRLTGTAVMGRFRMAIINGERVYEGQTYRRLLLEKVTTDGVTMKTPAGETLQLSLDIAPAPIAVNRPAVPVLSNRLAAPAGATTNATKAANVTAGESQSPLLAGSGPNRSPLTATRSQTSTLLAEPKSTRVVRMGEQAHGATRAGTPR